MNRIRPGEIYWVDDLPPLDGQEAGRHPVIIIDDLSALQIGEDPVQIVGVTTSDSGARESIELGYGTGSPTGLRQPSRAIPAWHLLMYREHLGELIGRVPLVKLEQIRSAIESLYDVDADLANDA